MKIDSRPWNGLFNPRSAEGGTALVEPTPHHIACDAIHVTFRADRDRIRRSLPPGTEPAEEGTCWIMVGDMVKISAADPDQYWRNPGRSNYNECVLGFNVRFGKLAGRFCRWSGSTATGPWGWARSWDGESALAVIERSLDRYPPSILPLGPGACAGGVVIRNGATVVRMKVSLDETSEQLASLPSYGSTTFGYRYLASPGPGIAAVDQLTESTPTNVRFAGIWRGKPWLQFGEGDNEELTQLGEIEVLEGYLYRRGWTLERNARLVHDYAAEAAVHA